MSHNNALVQALPFAVLVLHNPPVKMMAIVVMDGVAKDIMEFPICSCEDLQEQVVGLKLILRPHQLMHQGYVSMWSAMRFGGQSSRHTTAQPNHCQRAVCCWGWCHLHRATYPRCLTHKKLRTTWIGSHCRAEHAGCDVGLGGRLLCLSHCWLPCIQWDWQ